MSGFVWRKIRLEKSAFRLFIIGIVPVCFNGSIVRIGGCHSGIEKSPAAFRASFRISIIGIVSVCFNGSIVRIGGCHSGIEKIACRLQSVIPDQHYRHCFRLI